MKKNQKNLLVRVVCALLAVTTLASLAACTSPGSADAANSQTSMPTQEEYDAALAEIDRLQDLLDNAQPDAPEVESDEETDGEADDEADDANTETEESEKEVVVASVVFNKSSDLTLNVGDVNRRSATASTGGAVTYKSSDPSVATVDETGAVKCVAVGKAVISAHSEDVSASYNLTVIAAAPAVDTASSLAATSQPASTNSATMSEAEKVFANAGIVVNDKTTPAVKAGGKSVPIVTFYFYSADGRTVGSINGQAYMDIMQKYKVVDPTTKSYDAPSADGDWIKWFCDMFNQYRGLSSESRDVAVAETLEAYRYEVIRLTNIEREKAGLPAFEISEDAMALAQDRAREIADNFSHTRPNGLAGGAENIARGQTTPRSVVNDWMNSPGHRANILKPASDPSKGEYYATHIGVGCYKVNDKIHWVQTFMYGPEVYGK